MINSHKTAIKRTKPSLPVAWLKRAGKLSGDVLDYGCGRGFDADYFNFKAYDPYFRPELPEGKFDTVVCTYVLNVVTEEEASKIIKHIRSILSEKGRAYFAVRRDKFKEGTNTRGTFQRVVYLGQGFREVHKASGFSIYETM